MAAHFTQASSLDRSTLRSVARWQAQIDATRHIRAALPPRLTWEQPRVHGAGTRLLVPAVGPGWVAVGDAATCWDPISAHGLTLALRTGIDGANAVLHDLHGDTAPRNAYAERLHSATRRFEAEVHDLWRYEQRWPNSEYWSWRHRPPANLGAPGGNNRPGRDTQHVAPRSCPP